MRVCAPVERARHRTNGREEVGTSGSGHDGGCDEAVLETEVTNLGALRLYEGLGFVRDKRLHRYYLNGNDAFRLKVWFHEFAGRDTTTSETEPGDESVRST